jgi:hypothetical protein
VVSGIGILSGSGAAARGVARLRERAGGAGNAGNAGGAGNAGRTGGAGRSRRPWMLYAFTVPQLKTN